jgi:hypothetical protein
MTCTEHVPCAVSNHVHTLNRNAQTLGCGQANIRLGLALPDVIAGEDRRLGRIDTQLL